MKTLTSLRDNRIIPDKLIIHTSKSTFDKFINCFLPVTQFLTLIQNNDTLRTAMCAAKYFGFITQHPLAHILEEISTNRSTNHVYELLTTLGVTYGALIVSEHKQTMYTITTVFFNSTPLHTPMLVFELAHTYPNTKISLFQTIPSFLRSTQKQPVFSTWANLITNAQK